MKSIVLLFAAVLALTVSAQELKLIELSAPVKTGGKPLMECLATRHTTREFSAEKLPLQTVSNLLWAAFGLNREDGHRTAPSAMNYQETDIYVALDSGIYLYDAKANALQPVLAGDHREIAGKQDFVAKAPLNLIYVADLSRMSKSSDEDKLFYSACDAGFIAQNVYLFCASESMSCVVRGWVDREDVKKTLKLRPEQRVILAQTIGYPWKQ